MLDDLLKTMDTLLGEDGCPWDKEQTHQSLKPCLVEECQETIEAIESGNMESLKEELGDVLLQVVFHSKIAQKAGAFTLQDVIDGLVGKIVARHTHVFGNDKATSAEEAMAIWQANKRKEK